MTKAIPVKIVQGIGPVFCEISECTHVILHIPSRTLPEVFPVLLSGTGAGTGGWTWNGDTEKPTISPSILTRNHDETFRCHSWINNGQARFLADSTHDLAGKTVELLDVDPFKGVIGRGPAAS